MKRLKLYIGQSTLEYIMILAVVAAAIVGASAVFKEDLARAYNAVYNSSNSNE